jgi:membrane fusion protein (multidrug efflux system)
MMRPHKRVLRVLLLIMVPIAVAIGGATVWLRGGRSVGTENAYIKAHIAQVSPEISGRVAEVLVHDHMAVSAGQVLVRLDPAPFQMALDKAMAELDAARIAVETTRAIYVETRSELAEAEINAEFLGRQAQRNLMLQERAVVSATKLDEMQSQAQVAKNRVIVIKRRLDRVLAGLSGNPQLPTDQHPGVRERAAEVERAQLDLARTRISAPIAGTAVAVKLQPGDQLRSMTPIFVVVADTRPWVEANMKETDLTHVRPGQKATVVLDIYPDTVWDAVVDTISPAAGSEFAILPPQNASGNWVKVVQRLPVRVQLKPHDGEPPLRAGMTATVTIDIGRERSLADVFTSAAARSRPTE